MYDSASVILSKISSINFEIVANTPVVLSMTRYICDANLTQKLVDTDSTAKFLFTVGSQFNQPQYFKRLTSQDIENHQRTIQALLSTAELKNAQAECLETVLIEYLCN